jgi:NAD(P)-dependent dehydrogenase (short-subunit alcohol dehydrogenase family)
MSGNERSYEGQVALVTGGANGIGAAVAAALAGRGAKVVVADVDDEAGIALAESLDGDYVRCDVGDPAANEDAVARAVERYGGLDMAHLNAGVTTGCGVLEDFDLARYRRAMAVNLDGVVFGLHAVVPALEARGGGSIIVTASLAGLVGVPVDCVYGANKHAVVGLVRSLGPTLAARGVRLNALCPGFADTAIIEGLRDTITSAGIPIIPVSEVVEAFLAIDSSGESGSCWFVQAGRPAEPFLFRNVPGPR